ncbi:MAG: 1-(5-phosphoribosyl)-5-((5-phosphoribosylamino)methylideneamino)imidazole-4-carboxamide isomerase, partial [Deltaproteobacteria bacterium]
VELGGGIRTLEVAEGWLSLGVERVVLGTAALRDPSLLREAVRRFGQRVAVAIDARDGVVMVEGWRASSSRASLEVAEELKASGVSLVIYTDIKRDGMASGPNLEAARELSALGLSFILSGGIASLEDLERVKGLPGLVGVIVGRALYEGLIDLREAIRRFQG